jgi:hypothetical protein
MNCLIGIIVLGMGTQSFVCNGPKSLLGWSALLLAILFSYLLIDLGRDTFKRRSNMRKYNLLNSIIGIGFLAYTSIDFMVHNKWLPARYRLDLYWLFFVVYNISLQISNGRRYGVVFGKDLSEAALKSFVFNLIMFQPLISMVEDSLLYTHPFDITAQT